ncbi:HEAT repeat domain-containing protein [Anaeromyxobacter oryzae]|uniref:HEAT repeat domain-containing protein n=1 Tax=Anaeromyxobacter oryzae TaxID=2918170 RepID=UPI0020C156FD|nr:HEAT repeat domain-containing protein [Anaeromyxobacter oryzae]
MRTLRWVLFGILAASAALTLVGLPELQRAVAAGRWPPAALALPPAFLAVFIVGYAAYRFVLVRAGRYPAGKAFVQLGLMLLVLGVVAGIARERGRPPVASPVDLARALTSSDADVRAMAAELLRHRPRAAALPQVPRLVDLLADPELAVRDQARETLVALAGSDAGGEGPGAADRWRAYWREQGVLPTAQP